MRVLLRIIRRQAIGDITTQESSHSAPIIRIGRGADCDIHLPDAGIQLEHATLEARGDYAFIQAVGHASISVNAKVVDGIRLQVGDRIRLGLYELKVQESIEAVDGDEALVLTCERYEPDDAVLLGKAGTTTGSGVGARLGMRGLSWALGSLIFLIFFVWPIAAHYSAESRDVGALDTAMTAGHQPVGHWASLGRSAWLTGAVSRSHALFGDECTSCHQKAFVPVNATDCLTCHNDLQEHVRVEQFSFASLDATGCLQCHQEHEGNDQLVLNDSRLCVNCHQNLAATSKGLVEVSDVVGFSQHPEFRVHGVKSNIDTGLKFPHNIHLDSKGVLNLKEESQVLVCRDCHLVEKEGTKMAFPQFEEHCAACHGLRFAFEAPDRSMPHGDVAKAKTFIRDTYASVAVKGGLRLPIEEVPKAIRERAKTLNLKEVEMAQALAWVDKKSASVISGPFGKGQCAECHTIIENKDDPLAWDIVPVDPAVVSLTGARFDHALHRQVTCTACHDARESTAASDVLLPKISKCQSCHGPPSASHLLPTQCVDCHAFHQGHASAVKTGEATR